MPEKPNIVLINVDDMGWEDVGFMGTEYYQTPNIDSLSTLGMVFTDGYSSASNCAPSRANMLSGKWPQRHGVYTVGTSERGNPKLRKLIPIKNTEVINEKFELFPELLQKNGYATCFAGKWHISNYPLKKGFDVNIGGSDAGHPKSYYPPYRNVDLHPENGEYLTDYIMQKTLKFVDTTKAPFFLYYASYAVHGPIQEVDSLMHKYKNKKGWRGQNNPKYATMVENLDRNIGLLIEKLKSKGVFENTFLVFTSDNGGKHPFTEQKPLRAGKGSYYEGGIREPFFFVWPGKIKAGTKNKLPITNLDLYPTILDVAGVSHANLSLDGASLVDVLKGEDQLKKRDLFWNFPIYLQAYAEKNENRDPLFRTRPGSVIRSGNWKLHYYYENKETELYNLKNDIGENRNLATKHPEKTKELLGKLKNWLHTTQAPIPTKKNPAYDAAFEAKKLKMYSNDSN